MDKVFDTLITRLKKERIYNSTNIIVLSDHGMSSINSTGYLFIDKYVSNGLIDDQKSVIYGAVSNLYATEGNVRCIKTVFKAFNFHFFIQLGRNFIQKFN